MMPARQATYLPRGDLRFDEPMARHTSWRVGGFADQFFVPADRADLVAFLAGLPPGTPLTFLGLGSNLLVRDGGVRGVVVATHKCLRAMALRGAGRIYVEAGVPGAKIARFSTRHDLLGAEFFAGIPGTFGGALAMNAGAFGAETWDVVTTVDTVDSRGVVTTRTRDDFRVGYRSITPDLERWFLSGEIRLAHGDGSRGRARIRELLARRAQTQPIQIPNAGSVFRNPPGDFAARLIEASDLKGVCEGAARVSPRHANFIVNTGGATAEQIERLIERVRAAVAARQGVDLELEVHIVGEHG